MFFKYLDKSKHPTSSDALMLLKIPFLIYFSKDIVRSIKHWIILINKEDVIKCF